MEFHIDSQVSKLPLKIIISHIFVISGVISCMIKPKKFFLLVFLGEFQLYLTGFLKVYVTVLLLKKYLTSKIEESAPHGFFFFCNFMNPPILERKFSQPEMPLSLKYIFLFKFSNFSGCLKMLQITFCPQIQQEKSLKSP